MFDEFFGAAPAGEAYYHHLGGPDEALGARLKLDWDQLSDGYMPLELLLAQSLSRFERNGRHYSLAYKPLFKGEQFDGALLTVSDVTGEVAARRAEAEQREQVATIAHVLRDRSGFQEFFRESRRLLDQIRSEQFAESADRMRAIHTLKGNAALFHVTSVAEAAHALEQASIEGEESLIGKLTAALEQRWEEFAARIVPILGEDVEERFELTRPEFEQLCAAARPYPAVDGLVQRIAHEPLRTRFQRSAEQLRQLARRLGKADVEVLVSDAGIRLPSARFAQFWAVFAHVVRNVADHGLQTADERATMGKPEKNRVELKAKLVDATLAIEVVDDGRGIDWKRVCERAQTLGIEHRTREQQVAALFTDGFSTARNVSSTSGRGIGLSAILRACQALGGTCALESELGYGVCLTLSLPLMDEGSRGAWPRVSVEPTSELPRRSSAGSA
jgi:two-component system chemotaxis sensor kinase CheA